MALDDIDTKSLLTSRTVWGVLISIAGKVAAIAGLEIDDDVQGDLIDLALLGVSFFGDALALWGRAAAKKQISGVVTTP